MDTVVEQSQFNKRHHDGGLKEVPGLGAVEGAGALVESV